MPLFALGSIIWNAILAFLIGIIPTLTKSVLKAVGVGFVTYAGFELLFSTLQGIVDSNYNGLPPAMLQLLNLVGADSAIGMLFGTMAGIAAYKALTAATKLQKYNFQA